jgi:hypothetical protein
MTALEILEESIGRMRRILDTGAWPSGLPITSLERATLEWHLELARAERTYGREVGRQRHARQAIER